MNETVTIISVLLSSYLIGSIPFGVIVGRLYKVDITSVGSKNIGATNVLRALGPVPGAIVFICDALKGAVPVYIALFLGLDPLWVILAGFCAIVGHTFPVFLKFKGGRGVATALGVLLAAAPDVFLLVIILFAIILAFTRYVSLSSIVCSICAAIAMYYLGKPVPYVDFGIIIAALIIIKHIPNIRRLIAGEEHKIGEKI